MSTPTENHDPPASGVPGDDIGGSFWDIGRYKSTVKRADDGYKLCSDLTQLLHDRIEIEKLYVKHMKSWSKKWSDMIDKGPEYGTTKDAWKAFCIEADELANIHNEVKEALQNNVTDVKQWQKEHFHKNVMGVIKEVKEFDESFKKAQKPWAKKYEKVSKCRKDYHHSCKTERSAQNQEKNASSDESVSIEQKRKLADRVEKCGKDVSTTRAKYETSLKEISEYNDRYRQDMSEIFDHCQKYEGERQDFFKRELIAIKTSLDITLNPKFVRTYSNLLGTIERADSSRDLLYFSQHFGVEMSMNWPQFEEYSPELVPINKKAAKSSHINTAGGGDGSIRLTSISHQRMDSYNEYDQSQQQSNDSASNMSSSTATAPAVSASDHTSGGSLSSAAAASNGPSKESSDYANAASQLPPPPPPASSAAPAPSSAPQSVPSAYDDANTTLTNGGGSGQYQSQYSTGSSGGETQPTSNRGGGVVDSMRESTWDDDWGGEGPEDDPLVDNGEVGVMVKALYDYDGAEGDELSFKSGDMLEKLSDEDAQGWCKARFNGRVGLYPGAYCETTPVPTTSETS